MFAGRIEDHEVVVFGGEVGGAVGCGGADRDIGMVAGRNPAGAFKHRCETEPLAASAILGPAPVREGFQAFLEIIERGAHALEQFFAARRQRQVLALAGEERRAEMILQPLDAAADGGLRDVQLPSGAGKIHVPASGVEDAEGFQRDMGEHRCFHDLRVIQKARKIQGFENLKS